MAKSAVERTREKREKARAKGLCIVCCVRKRQDERSTCDACNVAVKVRIARMRVRQKEQRRRITAARGYEATGDAAMERFAYLEAPAQFERALAQSHTIEDEVRLCEKIGLAVFSGARPDLATPWFERALERCLATASLHWKAPYVMRYLPGQCWLESRTEDALAYAERARKLAILTIGVPEDATLIPRLEVLVANQLTLLGRYDEAARFLVESKLGEDQRWLGTYFCQRAILHATKGRAIEAFADFDLAVEIEKERADGYNTTAYWDDHANWAMALGRLDVARSCRERALFVARERRIAWRIPYLTLRFASMLVTAGDYHPARDLVADAMTYDTETPVLRVLKTIVAVELAHAIGDGDLLKRTLDDDVLEYAFRSGEPERIGSIVPAYAKVAIARGQVARTKKLITRGMATLNQADHVGDLLALAARYGSLKEASRAQHLLLERIRLPNHRVAQAYLELWEAQRAVRSRATSDAKAHAERAAHAFGRLGWKHQQADALVLAGRPRAALERDSSMQRTAVLSELTPALTSREQQVAELVLRGLTNRAIAEILSISEHTVESHMTSILSRLGLRSRWQLMDLSR